MTEKTKNPEKVSHKAQLRAIELKRAKADLRSVQIDVEREEIRLRDDKRQVEWALAKGLYNGTFRLDGGISDTLIANVTSNILQWKRVQQGTPPITLYITSGGGDAFASFSLFDTLRTLSAQGHTVTTVVRGFAASGAGVVAQAGDVRLIGAESFIHIHEAGSGIRGKASEMKDEMELLEKISRKMAEVYARRSTLSAEEIYEKFGRRELWISSAEALELGFADAIG